jgi:YD repeat-containing protein
LSEVLTTTDPLNRVKVLAYDALGRKISQTDNCVGTGGQCNGGVTSGQNLVTIWQVDALGETLQERSPRQCTGSAPCYQGSNGQTITDGTYLATNYAYDGLLRLTSVSEDPGHLNLVTTYVYDPSGNKLSQTDPRGYATTYTLDNLGRVTKSTDANTYAVQTSYSLAGEVTSTINARGKTNTNTLDRVGRLTGVSYFKANGTTGLSQNFGYDADGNKTSFSDTDVASTAVTYDHLNRASTVTAPAPLGTTTYTYFFDGAVNTITDATGTTTFTAWVALRPWWIP